MEKVLVVDDEADILRLVSENLAIRGYQVSEAKTANDALSQVYGERPALMVLDIKLPDLTGWELLDRMEQDPDLSDHFPVLIMTASITDANMNLSNYPNVVEIIIKPFSISQLVSAVKRSLEHYHQ